MSGETRNGKCRSCGQRRKDHLPDEEGLKLRCKNGVSVFSWPQASGRASTSFSTEEVHLLDALVAKAMTGYSKGDRAEVLRSLRKKTLAMKKKVTG